MAEQFHSEQQLRLRIDSHVQPTEFAVDTDRCLVDSDPRRRYRRWVGLAIRLPMRPRPDRSMRAIDTEPLEDGGRFLHGKTPRVQANPDIFQGVGVRSFSPVSRESIANGSLVRFASCMITTHNDLLASQTDQLQ